MRVRRSIYIALSRCQTSACAATRERITHGRTYRTLAVIGRTIVDDNLACTARDSHFGSDGLSRPRCTHSLCKNRAMKEKRKGPTEWNQKRELGQALVRYSFNLPSRDSSNVQP